MPLRTYVPNPTPDDTHRLLTALQTTLFAFELIGAITFAAGTIAIVAHHTGFYPAVMTTGAFTFAYALVGLQLTNELRP